MLKMSVTAMPASGIGAVNNVFEYCSEFGLTTSVTVVLSSRVAARSEGMADRVRDWIAKDLICVGVSWTL